MGEAPTPFVRSLTGDDTSRQDLRARKQRSPKLPKTISPDTAVRYEQASRVDVHLTKIDLLNPWGVLPTLERTYASPRPAGYGARRAVKKYSDALRRLAQ